MAEVPASRNAAVPYPWQSDHMPLRCLLVDDNEAFLEAASLLLEREGLTVVGVASSIAEALRQARALRPDVILVDIGLGEEPGQVKAALFAEPDVDEDDVRAQRAGLPKRLGDARGHAHDGHALSLQEKARGLEEGRVVIDE